MAYVLCQAKFPPVRISDWYFKRNLVVASKILRKNRVVQDPELGESLVVCSATIFPIYPGAK